MIINNEKLFLTTFDKLLYMVRAGKRRTSVGDKVLLIRPTPKSPWGKFEVVVHRKGEAENPIKILRATDYDMALRVFSKQFGLLMKAANLPPKRKRTIKVPRKK